MKKYGEIFMYIQNIQEIIKHLKMKLLNIVKKLLHLSLQASAL